MPNPLWTVPLKNTLLTVDLPHRGTPYSTWTCPCAKRPYLGWTCPTSNTPLTVDLTHNRTPYSSWTSPTRDHPTHCWPAPPRNTLLTLDHVEHLLNQCYTNCKGRGHTDTHFRYRLTLQFIEQISQFVEKGNMIHLAGGQNSYHKYKSCLGAFPAMSAWRHLREQRHQRSPGRRPGGTLLIAYN